MFRFEKVLIIMGLVALTAQPLSADQKWVATFPGAGDLEEKQLFKIRTEGPMGRDPTIKIQEEGTAFAITENMLVTARHVTRNAEDFANLAAGGKIHIPDRLVSYDYARDKVAIIVGTPLRVASVTPAATPTIDATRLNLGISHVTPFKLSVCDIVEDQEYYLLKFRDGNMNIPRIVPIVADVEAYTDHGEARQFTHNSAGLDTPKPGDSGAPILDRNGHVVGLLTAIKDAEKVLYVTLTRSFIELVPGTVDVECADRVHKHQVDTLQTSLLSQIEHSKAERADLRRTFDAQAQAMEQAFNTRTTEMQTAIDTLIEENKRLTDQISRATTAANATIRVLKKIDAEGLLSELEPKVYQAIIDDLKSQRPVIPQVEQMFKDLGLETWTFTMRPTVGGGEFLTVTADYDRNISRPRYAEAVWFCIRPLMKARTLEEQDELDDDQSIVSQKYFRATDKLPQGKDHMRCSRAQHPQDPTADRNAQGFNDNLHPFKSGSYRFQFDGTVPVDEMAPEFTGLYYGIMYIDNGTQERDITHRFIFDVNPAGDAAAPKCYVWDNDDGRGDTFATFVQSSEEEREVIQQCTDT